MDLSQPGATSSTFGSNLRAARKERGLSLRALASKMEISAPYLSDIELGRRQPSIVVILKVVDALGLDREVADRLRRQDPRPVQEGAHRRIADDPDFREAVRYLLTLDRRELLRTGLCVR